METVFVAIHVGWFAPRQNCKLGSVCPGWVAASFEQVSQLEVLGALLCDDGGQREALDHRLGKAEKVYRKYQSILCGRGSHAEKLRAWDSTVMASAAYCSGTLALTKTLATHVHSWEHRMLRQVFRLRPTADDVIDNDGWQSYYSKSRDIIDLAKQKSGQRCLVHRMLREYFHEAWLEKERLDRDQKNRTETLRLYRSRQWWEAVLRTPLRYRKPVGWVHGRPGVPIRQWEDLLVEFRGVNWRSWRDSIPDEHGWRHHVNILIDEVCAAWGLPLLPVRSSKAKASAAGLRKPHPHFPQTELEHEDDKNWENVGARFVFIMDSQVVQQVVCGHAALTNEKYRLVFRRITSKFVKFIDGGLLPPSEIADPVQWRPREYNAKSDWLCNQALDAKSSFSFVDDDLQAYCVSNVQWEAFSDGACRGDGFSSFAWIIYATWPLGNERHRFTVAFGYEFMVGNYSSFSTELWGLERAVETLNHILERTNHP